jgi:prepilin-type N-terminal cleavage/methylation domain-containing protein
MRHLRIRARGDEGMTLVETMVAIVLVGVLGAIILAASVSSKRSLVLADDETRGQEDVAQVVDRLGRDVRNARGVVCDGAASDPLCTNHLQLWADYNSNYKQDAGETITWSLQAAGDGEHFDVIRTVDGGAPSVQARTIVSDIAFTYRDEQPKASQPAPGLPTTREVVVQMTYDAIRTSGTQQRTVAFTAMLRNVP